MWWSNLFAGMSPANFFNFSFLPKYLSFFVQGLEYTLLLSIISVGLAVIPALALALMRLSRNKIVRNLSGAYIAVFRSTPMMVQLYIIFYGLFSVIKIPSVVILGFIDLSRFIPGVVALALNSSAYVAEIIRAGILAVDGGQNEAARSLGLSSWQSMKLVVLPQAIKNVLPALGNEFIVLLKETSIAGYIGLRDLTKGATSIGAVAYDYMVPLLCVAFIYFLMTTTLAAGMNAIERRMRRGD
jgi:His/Glu/Gln/Arg/opine family amino acid ABC transporter permease subunit